MTKPATAREPGRRLARAFLGYGVALAITAFFAVMWGLLLRQHLPKPGPRTLKPAYDALIGPDERERTLAWGVYFGNARVGRAEMTVTRQEDDTILVRSDTRIELGPALRLVFGVPGDLDVEFRATVSPLRGLLDFQVESELLKTSLQGSVVEKEVAVVGNVGGELVKTRLPYDQDKLVGQTFAPLSALPELDEHDVGAKWTINIVNPLGGDVQEVDVRVAEVRDATLDGEPTKLFKLAFTRGTTQWTSWVSQDGQMLIQGTPFGVRLQREGLPEDLVRELLSPPPAAPTAATP